MSFEKIADKKIRESMAEGVFDDPAPEDELLCSLRDRLRRAVTLAVLLERLLGRAGELQADAVVRLGLRLHLLER